MGTSATLIGLLSLSAGSSVFVFELAPILLDESKEGVPLLNFFIVAGECRRTSAILIAQVETSLCCQESCRSTNLFKLSAAEAVGLQHGWASSGS